MQEYKVKTWLSKKKKNLDTKNYKWTQKIFDALKVEILFYSMISMRIIFHFNIIILKNEHLHVDLSRFYKIASTCRKCAILQNGLQVDVILNFFYFQENGALKIHVYY
jgi:hypothetical protein